jgi:predicted RNA binding protein YcfA (HicA-like mRNA interferase family)
MGKKLPLLKPREVRANLLSLGFIHKRTDGSHETWERAADPLHSRAVVTVDSTKNQFDAWLMKSMIRQSKLTQEEFCSGSLSQASEVSPAKKPAEERKANAKL